MGWNFCLATESDRTKANSLRELGNQASEADYESANKGIIHLSRQFSYALLHDDGKFRKWLTEHDIASLAAHDVEAPERWQNQEPQQLLQIFYKIRDQLEQKSANMPTDHFLWFVDEHGKRWNGATVITLPPGGIELKVPHEPMVKLEGHRDSKHRNELRLYNLRIDAALLAQHNHELEEIMKRDHISPGSEFILYGNHGPQTNPIVEEFIGWLPVEPVLEVLGYRVEVNSVNALSMFRPDLNLAIDYCEQALRTGSPLYWLTE
jgi:hypothetical protein